jgi:surface antigen
MMLSSQPMYAEEYREDIASSIEDEVSGVDVEAYKTGDDYPWDLKSVAIDSKVDPWNFYNRECTSLVAWCLNDRNEIDFHNYYGGVRWGNAKNWGTAARSIGITVNKTPSVGSVAWWESGQYGHVAWVNAINGDEVTIEEYNGSYPGEYSSREISSGSPSGYIHIKDISSDNPGVNDVEIIDRGYCGEEGDGTNISWTLDTEGVLRIEGSGRMKSWSMEDAWPGSGGVLADWHRYYEEIKAVNVSSGINGLGTSAFAFCRSLSSIQLPDSVTSIGDYAFDGCCSLSSIKLPSTLTTTGDHAFYDCTSLSSIQLPSTLTMIGDNAFYDCRSLRSIHLPD